MIPTHDIDPDRIRDMRIDDQLCDAAIDADSRHEAYDNGADLGNQLVLSYAFSPLAMDEWLPQLDAERRRADRAVDDPATALEFRSALAGYAHALARFILENS